MAFGIWLDNYFGKASGGGGFEVVNITPDGHIGNVTSGTYDKTYDELLAAHNAGKIIFANISIGNGAGPDARMIPLAVNDFGSFVGASIIFNGATNKQHGLYISIFVQGGCTINAPVIA